MNISFCDSKLKGIIEMCFDNYVYVTEIQKDLYKKKYYIMFENNDYIFENFHYFPIIFIVCCI